MNVPFTVLEFVDGETLEKAIERTQPGGIGLERSRRILHAHPLLTMVRILSSGRPGFGRVREGLPRDLAERGDVIAAIDAELHRALSPEPRHTPERLHHQPSARPHRHDARRRLQRPERPLEPLVQIVHRRVRFLPLAPDTLLSIASDRRASGPSQ